MHILKTALSAVLALGLLSTVVRAGDPPMPNCVVNGDKFSEHEHGPISVTYKGRTIPVCCNSCVRKFNKNPEKFIKAYDDAEKAAKGGAPAPADAAKPSTAAKTPQ